MSVKQFGISSDIYCSSVNTNKLNCQEIVSNSIDVSNINLPVGGQYQIGGTHLLSTPIQGSSLSLTPGSISTGQQTGAVAIGNTAGQTSQGELSVAIGTNTGQITQSGFSVAVGSSSAETNQGSGSVAVGFESANESQGANCVAVGNAAGYVNQGGFSVSVGYHSCFSGCGGYNVAVGSNSCANNIIGEYNTCIGDSSSVNTGINSSIVIGAGGIATLNNQFVLGSISHPLTTSNTAGAVIQYLPVTLNGVNYKLPLYGI